MPPAGFEHTISAGERPQNYALDHEATGTDWGTFLFDLKTCFWRLLQCIVRDSELQISNT